MDLSLDLAFRYEESSLWFNHYLSESGIIEVEDAVLYSESFPYIYVRDSDFEFWEKEFDIPKCPKSEYELSLYRISDALTQVGMCIYHAAALLWKGKAWLISADSGVGKTTQLRHWCDLYGDEIQIINGDKPVLKLSPDGTVHVHSSPWKGKENLGDDDLSAPLGGIILLKQGKENVINKLGYYECGLSILSHFLNTFDTEEILNQICKIENAILFSTPIWELINKGDEASAKLTHDTIVSEVFSYDDL